MAMCYALTSTSRWQRATRCSRSILRKARKSFWCRPVYRCTGCCFQSILKTSRCARISFSGFSATVVHRQDGDTLIVDSLLRPWPGLLYTGEGGTKIEENCQKRVSIPALGGVSGPKPSEVHLVTGPCGGAETSLQQVSPKIFRPLRGTQKFSFGLNNKIFEKISGAAGGVSGGHSKSHFGAGLCIDALGVAFSPF